VNKQTDRQTDISENNNRLGVGKYALYI